MRSLVIVGIASSVAACGDPSHDGATALRATIQATLTCQQLTFEAGSLPGGQSIATLATQDLSGTQDVWARYVELAPGASATCTFPLDGIAPARLVGLSLRTNYRGPRLADMRWVFEVWNASTATWATVGDNAFAQDWIWSRTTLPFPPNPSAFVSNDALRVRVRATSSFDASNIDELVVIALVNDDPAPPDAGTPTDAGTTPTDAGAPPTPDASAPPTPDAGTPPTPDAGIPGGDWWRPAAGTTWDWQLASPISHAANVQVYDIDLFQNTAAEIAALHSEGRKVICYVNLGAWENWRLDASAFPNSVKGTRYHGFPDERWLDIRRIDVLAPIMRARLDQARSKGCDGIEPDNMDGYDTTAHESTGFPLTYQHQITYNRWIANEAHQRQMAVGLKNDIAQAADLVGDFDFAVSEECFQYGECHFFVPFINANKPVFEAEYGLPLGAFCPQANAMNFSSIRKRNELDTYREACR